MARNDGIGFWLTRRAQLTPARTALVFEGRSWTYRELNEQVDRCATSLSDLGVCHGDRVAVLTINVPEFLEVLFACGKLGAVFVPKLNLRRPPAVVEPHACSSGAARRGAESLGAAGLCMVQPRLARP